MNWTIIIIETIILTAAFTAIILIPLVKNPVWWIADYPWGLFTRFTNVSQQLILFLSVGFCGGFTTFSTFSKESFQLIQSGNWLYFSLYVAGSIVLGILLVASGYQIAK